MTARPDTFVRALGLGLVSGLRTFTGLAALTVRTDRRDRQPEKIMTTPWAKAGVSALAVGELIMDKLPATPDRRSAPPALGRAAAGALCGWLALRRFESPDDRRSGAPSALTSWGPVVGLGAGSAVLTTVIGPGLRSFSKKRFGLDAPGATIEDLAAIIIAWAATGPSRRDQVTPHHAPENLDVAC